MAYKTMSHYTDPRLMCEFHPDRPAVALAPRHKGGDDDVPCEYTPICAEHLAEWYGNEGEGIPDDERLPIFNLAALLAWDEARAAWARMSEHFDSLIGASDDYALTDDECAAMDTISRFLGA